MYLLLTIGESFSGFRYKVFHGIYFQLISGESFSGFIPNWAQGSPMAEPLQDAGPFWEARVWFLSAHLRSALRLEAAEASLGGRHRKTEMDHKTCESRLLISLPMLGLLSSKAQESKVFLKPPKPCCVGIHWIALAEYSQMSTHLPGFQAFFRVFASFCIAQISHQQH